MLSIRSECLARIVPLSEAHLRHAVNEYVEHYNRERNHQGLDNLRIDPLPTDVGGKGPVRTRQRLEGILNAYYRDAA